MSCFIIVFDWDGTLLDSKSLKRDSFCDSVRELLTTRFNILVDGSHLGCEFDRLSGLPRSVLVEALFKALGHSPSIDEIETTCLAIAKRIDREMGRTSIFPDVFPILKRFAIHDVAMSISSSVPQRELQGLVQRFLPVEIAVSIAPVLGSQINLHKGADHFREICAYHGVGLEKLVYVGDDEIDYQLTRTAGVKFVRVLRPTDIVREWATTDQIFVSDFTNLPDLIQKNWGFKC